MTQFAFLQLEFADVHGLAVQAESIARTDPRGACVYARLALETVVQLALSLRQHAQRPVR